jgi:hypothetical protein
MTTKPKKSPLGDLDPDKRPLTKIQAERLGAIAKLDPGELAGRTVAELSEKLKWQIDPELFFFRRVCGRVVKKDPVTGIEYPVPFATVEVQDTDCRLIWYTPFNWRWGWFYPFHCRREVIATVKTDECGRFCVYVPRFDIDWILRWRRERVCLPDIFVRPSIKDLLPLPEIDLPKPPFPKFPIPPRPGPFDRLPNVSPAMAEALGGVQAKAMTERHAIVSSPSTAIELDRLAEDMETARAFPMEMQAPLPAEFQKLLSGMDVIGEKPADPSEAITAAVAKHAGLHPKEIEGFDIGRFIGPFHRCFDIFVPEWQAIFDVPDITFRVLQDVDGDGDEEVIYSEGYFDVRWNAGAIPPVKLVASDIARESRTCDTPNVLCSDIPALLFAGMMPLNNASYFNASNGYAIRPNRPRSAGMPYSPAAAPFLGVVNLYGCVNIPKAAFYRVMQSTDNGANYNAITGLNWNIFPIPSGAPHLVTPDPDGWYPVLTNPAAFHPANLVLAWPTPLLAKSLLKIEVADAAKVMLQESAVVAIRSDNTAPAVNFDKLAWKFEGDPDSDFDLPSHNLLVACPTIRRGSPARSIIVRFEVSVSANHLRDAGLSTSGCGGGSFTKLPPSGTEEDAHWHQNTADNAVTLKATYRLDATALEGSYGFHCQADSRAMNPSGGDGGHLVPPDWFYDPVYSYVIPGVNVAIVNA